MNDVSPTVANNRTSSIVRFTLSTNNAIKTIDVIIPTTTLRCFVENDIGIANMPPAENSNKRAGSM